MATIFLTEKGEVIYRIRHYGFDIANGAPYPDEGLLEVHRAGHTWADPLFCVCGETIYGTNNHRSLMDSRYGSPDPPDPHEYQYDFDNPKNKVKRSFICAAHHMPYGAY